MNASEQLEAAILADRDDVQMYLVYADELQQRGDPRGELVVMQNQLDSIEDSRARERLFLKCAALIEQHDLLGPLRDFGDSMRERFASVTWRYGFIRCLEIGWGPEASDSPDDARQTLEAILRHPSSPFITYLVLGPAPGARKQMSMQCFVDAIAATGCPKALRTLHLGKLNEWSPRQTRTGVIGEASAALGRLQKLTLEAGTIQIGALALPELVELRILCNAIDDATLEELCSMQCPKLRSLDVRCAADPRNGKTLTAHLKARLKHVRKVAATTQTRSLW